MENTTLNKIKFFSQYYGQLILMQKDGLGVKKCVPAYWEKPISTRYLELTPLHLITDEDARKLPNRQYDGFTKMYENKEEFLNTLEIMHFLTQEETDLLRVMGYAVSFQDLSVPRQVERGWVVLKTKI